MIEKAIKNLKLHKASGIDGVSNEIICFSSPFIMNILELLFNEVLQTRYFPSGWNLVMISPLFKSDDPHDPNNYRGISLLSCLGKLFCSIVNEYLTVKVESAQLLTELQGGFRRKRGCREQSFLLLSTLLSAEKRRGKQAFCTFVDFKKAYDSVRHSVLWDRLKALKLGPKLLDLLKSIYDRVKCTVRHGGKLSSFFPYDIGVRQGCILSPIIFNLFINELHAIIHKNVGDLSGIKVADLVIFVLLYADDVVLVADSPDDLSILLRSLEEFCASSSMSVNVKKTKVVIFFQSRAVLPPPLFVFDHKPLEVVREYKYLGCFFDEKLSFSHHVDVAISRAEKASFSLFQRLLQLKNMKMSMKLRLYQALVLSVLLYNVEVWGPCISKGDLKKLEKFHTSCLRRLLMVGPKFPVAAVYWLLGVLDIESLISQKVFKFLISIKSNSDHPIFRKTLEHIGSFNNKFKKSFRKLCEGVGIASEQFFHDLFLPPSFSKIRSSLFHIFFQKIKNIIDNNKKLTFFSCFLSESPGPHPFLELYNVRPHERRAMTNFLGGCHHLRIEVGRWRRVPGPARVCRLCGSDSEVEDELHVLFTCPFFQDQRDELLLSVIRGNEGHTVVGDELLDFLRKEKSWEENLGFCKFIT